MKIGLMLVACSSDDVVGCVAYRKMPSCGDGVCEMKRLYIKPEVRGKGIGRKLVERLLIEAAAAGYHTIKLDTLSDMKVRILSFLFQIAN